MFFGIRLSSVIFFVCLISAGPVMADFRMSVKVDNANVRSGPGTHYKVSWKLEKWHPINITKQSGEWYHFEDFEGDTGWIHKSLVGRTRTVIVTGDDCNVRAQPNINGKIRFKSGRGVSYKVLSRKGDWVRIRHAGGDTGWIFGSLVW